MPGLRTFAVALQLAWLVPVPAASQPAAGDLLVSEFQAGSVVNVHGGGDLAAASRFATGLSGPYGLCVGPGGDVYVAEFSSGEITVITSGGDFSGALPFADGLSGPVGLVCSDSQILVSELRTGEVTDVSAGGDASAAQPFAIVPGEASGLLRDASGRLFVAAGRRIYEVTGGGGFAPADAFAYGGAALRALAERSGRLLVADSAAHRVTDFTGGGDLATLPVHSELLFPAGLVDAGPFGFFVASDGLDGIWDATKGGELSTMPPGTEGVAVEFFAGMAFIDRCGDGALQAGEACDDGNRTPGDGCSEACELQLCAIPPDPTCIAAGRTRLRIRERIPGREKLSVKLTRGGSADLGDPVLGTTRVDLCVYDAAGRLAGELRVDRAGDGCGERGKPCWSSSGSGSRYRDPLGESHGARRLTLSGAGKRGRARVRGANDVRVFETRLPTGIAEALEGEGAARVQLMTSDGDCLDGELTRVRRSDALEFRASGP
jgi:cysteine-rich repeat protein